MGILVDPVYARRPQGFSPLGVSAWFFFIPRRRRASNSYMLWLLLLLAAAAAALAVHEPLLAHCSDRQSAV
jgi:hypothetical protein